MRAAAEAEKPPAVPPLGKKAQAEADAEKAHEGTSWESLVGPLRGQVHRQLKGRRIGITPALPLAGNRFAGTRSKFQQASLRL